MTEHDPFAEHATYKGIRSIGQGGAGEVWEVQHRGLGNKLAAKLIHHHLTSDDQMMERLAIEAKAQARVRHPNLLAVQDMGTSSDGRPFYVMPLLKGRSLEAELRARGELPLREARQIMLQILDGLGALHEQGLIHRDIKPANIFICDGKPRTIKVVDLGVIKVTEASRVVQPLAAPTQAGMCVGTPRYMAPEQARAAKLDARTDLYAAGLVMYKMIAGRGPFDNHTTVGRMLVAQVTETPKAPSMFAKQQIDSALDDVIFRALAKNPADRHATARDFATALQRVRLDLRGSLDAIEQSQAIPLHSAPNATIPLDDMTTTPLDNYTITVPVRTKKKTLKMNEVAGGEAGTRRVKSGEDP